MEQGVKHTQSRSCSSVSIVNFEHVIADWVTGSSVIFKNLRKTDSINL